MTAQLGHERLAETHDFGIGLALRIEVGAALAAAHRQAGQGVLENLLEAKELDDALVHARVETQTALVRADRGVELDAVTAVDLHLALIVRPGDAELHHALRLDEALEHARLLIFRVLLNNRLEAFEDLANGLQELRLVAIALLDLRVHALDVLISEHIFPLRDSWVINTAVSFYVHGRGTHKILLRIWLERADIGWIRACKRDTSKERLVH